jgi:hypothetical protein
MAEKGKQEHFSQEGSPEDAPSKKRTREPPLPMADDNFARRAGEIIASAVRTASAPFDRGGKRK